MEALLERLRKLGWPEHQAKDVVDAMAKRAAAKGISVQEEYNAFVESILVNRVPQ